MIKHISVSAGAIQANRANKNRAKAVFTVWGPPGIIASGNELYINGPCRLVFDPDGSPYGSGATAYVLTTADVEVRDDG